MHKKLRPRPIYTTASTRLFGLGGQQRCHSGPVLKLHFHPSTLLKAVTVLGQNPADGPEGHNEAMLMCSHIAY